jgi:hypothetical protein
MVAVLSGALGCTPSSPSIEFGKSCGTTVDGKILLAWTIQGQPATPTACQGIDHLQLVLAPDLCHATFEIEPIPCERAGFTWRYDNLARGGTTLTLTAFDANERAVAAGTARVTVGPDLPTTPTTIDLE